LDEARQRIGRVQAADLERLAAEGALVVDIRPEAQRAAEGELGFGLVIERNVLEWRFGLVIERNVLEWRFDLLATHAVPEATSYDLLVVVVCSEGYASSLAAASLRELGYRRAADLEGGYRAWSDWKASDLKEDV
jgi:rhodanese-related sulfurtransferase